LSCGDLAPLLFALGFWLIAYSSWLLLQSDGFSPSPFRFCLLLYAIRHMPFAN